MNLRQNFMRILGQQEIRHFPSCIVCSFFLWSDVAADHWPTRKFNRVLRRDCPVRVEARVTPAPASKRAEDREFVVDSGASMHMLSNNVFELRRNGDSVDIQEHHNGGNGHWGFANKRGSTGIRSRSWSLRPAILSLGKLCEENGKTYEWSSGKQPRSTRQGKKNWCKKSNCVRLVVPGLSSKFWYEFILHIATARLVKYIIKDTSKSSIRAKWRARTRKLVAWSTKKPQQKQKKNNRVFGRPFARSSRTVGGVRR